MTCNTSHDSVVVLFFFFLQYSVLTAYFGLVIHFGVKDEVLVKYEFLFARVLLEFFYKRSFKIKGMSFIVN